MKGTLLNPISGSLKRDLIERVYIPKSPPTPSSYRVLEVLGCRPSALVLKLGLGFRV